MDDLIENNKWIKKIRVLTQGLIISGALNLGFLTTFTVMAVKNMQKKKPSSRASYSKFSKKFNKSFSWEHGAFISVF